MLIVQQSEILGDMLSDSLFSENSLSCDEKS